MKGSMLLLCTLLFFISCSTIPKLEPLNSEAIPGVINECRTMFPTNGWQFVHSIEATIQGRQKAFLIGITDILPDPGRIHCVMMTIEGLVLFDAVSDEETVIKRGIRPFDSMAFAKGLMNDIRLIFFRPDGECTKMGMFRKGSYVCRYGNDGNTIVDLIANPDRTWEIRQYKNGDLSRSVKAYLNKEAHNGDGYAVPRRLELTAHGVHAYVLVLSLIRAEQVAR
ncbi:MAG: hypothetical protein JRH09_02345 [Deltaproteobacteria bacterium]|nr:hypothetical protein [Deltaproteobacteria bacterium]